MPPVIQEDIRVSGDAPEPIADESQSSKPIIGIIYPPPEVRNIVDKTASFVGRNGPEFEARIRQNEINNNKFNFLNSADPYHAYYRHKVKEFLEGKGKEPTVTKQLTPSVKPSVAVVQEKFVPKDPPPAFEFIADPPSISAYDLDVVRLTAQFVARNGRSFLTQLMQREAKNFQFDFLRPQHSLFQYFTKLVEQYTKILIPPNNVLAKLRSEIDNPKSILDEVNYRVEWTKHEERIRQREQQAIEKEKMMYAQIDWHDFVVVETVDFQPDERGNFPRPVKVEELGARLLQQERIEKYGEEIEKEEKEPEEEEEESEEEEEEEAEQEAEVVGSEHPLVDMDVEESSDEDDDDDDIPEHAHAQMKPPPAPPLKKEDVIIRTDYNPKMKLNEPVDTSGESFMISPITGEKVPAGKIQDHMRYSLLDPNWKELKKKQIHEKAEEEEVFAAGMDIGQSLGRLAERRTDIFGVEETAIGKKVGEEELNPNPMEENVSWDGFSSSMNKTQKQATEKVSVEDQILHIRKTQGLLVDENLEKIGPQSETVVPKEIPTPVPKPVAPPEPVPAPFQAPQHQHTAPPPQQVPHQQQQQQQNQPQLTAVQVQPVHQATVLTPVVMRPMIQVPRPNPPVLVVQQQMPRPQLIAVQRPQMMMSPHPAMVQAQMLQPNVMTQIRPQMQQANMQQMGVVDMGPPQAKRPRTEADLLPQEIFLQQNNGPVSFRVQCPSLPEKVEWNCQGQVLTITLPLTDEVSVIKAKIHEVTGMPAGKQKLQLDGLFIKDSNSLAHYNMNHGCIILLQVKERGGRRK